MKVKNQHGESAKREPTPHLSIIVEKMSPLRIFVTIVCATVAAMAVTVVALVFLLPRIEPNLDITSLVGIKKTGRQRETGREATSLENSPLGEPGDNSTKINLIKRAKFSTLLIHGMNDTGESWDGSAVVFAYLQPYYLAMTNAHVIKNADEFAREVQSGKAKLIAKGGFDQKQEVEVRHVFARGFKEMGLDLAILVFHGKFTAGISEIPGKVVQEREWIFSIGHPLGEEWFHSEGIIIERKWEGNIPVLIHNATVEHGSSGGGVFNNKGEFVGINFQLEKSSDKKRDYGRAIDVHIISSAFVNIRLFRVFANMDWQSKDMALKNGDRISLAVFGEWKLGAFAGVSGPEGIKGYSKYSYDKRYPHGALLMGDSGNTIMATELSYAISEGGELRFRVNDTELTDNSGMMDVVVIHWKKEQPRKKR